MNEIRVKLNFISIETWSKTRKDKPKCEVSGELFTAETGIALVFTPKKPNKVVTNSIGLQLISEGAFDIQASVKKEEAHKAKLRDLIESFKHVTPKLPKNPTLVELEGVYEKYLKIEKEQETILEDSLKWKDVPMEEYLEKDWGFVELARLKSPLDITNYFKDCGSDYFTKDEDGDIPTKVVVKVKISDKFYEITLHAELGSEKVEWGDRIYFFERISKVEYKVVDKPLPKERHLITFTLKDVTGEDVKMVSNYLRNKKIDFT